MITPIISIICNTYNQEKYIAQALDSFLMQKVSVPFEVLVHDDASTDGTADVIRKYAEKYPDIIKPIIQTENQYSREGLITYRFQIPRAQGKYLAFCEGDDYWIDSNKLQKQYDYMEANSECSACCHAYDMVDVAGKLIEHRNDWTNDTDIPLPKFLDNQLEIPQLATFFVRKEILKGFSGIYLGARANDMVLRIFCAANGNIHYFDKNMSAYRRFVEGSWTMRIGQDIEKMAKGISAYIPFLEQLDEATGLKYHNEIEIAIDKRRYQTAWLLNDYRKARECKMFSEQSVIKKIMILVGCICPGIVNGIRRMKG